MTSKEAVNWLINLTADIGKSEHHDLWHYEQALSEIKEMLEGKDTDVPSKDTISRKQAIDRLETIGYDFSDSGLSEIELEEVCEAVGDVRQDMIRMIKQLPSAQPERWDTCFSCPLSHGCPVINGCTNDQAEQYAGEIPADCPLDKESAQPEIIRCKDCKYSEHWYRDKTRCFLWHETGIDVFEDGYCNYAKRRTDEDVRGKQDE